MRNLYLPFILSTAVLALPQTGPSLNDLPVCAQNAALTAIRAAGCGLTDLKCICNSAPVRNTLREYIVQNCGQSDIDAALAFSQAVCAADPFPVSASNLYVQPGYTVSATTVNAGTVTSTTSTTPAGASAADAGGVSISSQLDVAGTAAATATPATYTGGAESVGLRVGALVGIVGLGLMLV